MCDILLVAAKLHHLGHPENQQLHLQIHGSLQQAGESVAQEYRGHCFW